MTFTKVPKVRLYFNAHGDASTAWCVDFGPGSKELHCQKITFSGTGHTVYDEAIQPGDYQHKSRAWIEFYIADVTFTSHWTIITGGK